MSTTKLDKKSFQRAVEDGKTLIVDFWASWCGPCMSFAPVFDEASKKHEDIIFGKVNTEEEQELAGGLGIRSIPTLMVFREQVLLFNQAGSLSPSQLEELITQIKALDMAKVHSEIAEEQKKKADAQPAQST
jgi:thioredoxin 2